MEYTRVIIITQNLLDLLNIVFYIDPNAENCYPKWKINQNKIKCHWGDFN